MKDKGHFIVSVTKSGIRIFGCVVCLFTKSLTPLAVGFLLAEFLGVLEEVLDKR